MTTRTVLIIVAVVLALVVVLGPLLFMLSIMLGMGGMIGPGITSGMMSLPGGLNLPSVLAAVSWLLVMLGVVMLLIWGIRRFGNRSTGGDDEPPLVILQRRYARGEIGPEEYERIRSDLLRDGGHQ